MGRVLGDPAARKRQALTLSLSPEEKERLEAIALSFGATWGEEGNISELMRMIASGRATIHKPGSPVAKADRDYFKSQILALKGAIANLEKLA